MKKMKKTKKIISLFLVIVMCVPMFLTADSFAADFGETSPEDWILGGVCSYDISTGVYTLMPDKTWSTGTMKFNTPIASDFSLSLDYYTGNRSGGQDSRNGGDGFAVLYYSKNLTLSDYWRPSSGYSVEIDTYCDDGFEKKQIHENHVAINTATSNHIAVVPIVEAEDDGWHNLRITVISGKCTVFIDGTERISYDTPTNESGTLGIYCKTGAARNTHAVKNIFVSDSVEPEKKFFDGYDEKYDQYGFVNQTKKIDSSYYTDMFGAIKGKILYWREGDGTDGQCYGMAATTALFLSMPTLLTGTMCFDKDEEYNAERLSYLSNDIIGDFSESFVSPINMYLSDFIKYGFIIQFTPSISAQKDDLKNKYNEIIAAVKRFVDGSGGPIVLGVRKKGSGHALFPVGYKETKDSFIVYIDDSNACQVIRELVFKYDDTGTKIVSWSYGNFDNNQQDAKIYYSMPCSTLYDFCQKNGSRSINDADVTIDNSKLLSIENSNLAIINSTTNEVLFDSSNGTNEDVYEVLLDGGEDDEVETSRSFWLDDDINNFEIRAQGGDTEFVLTDNNKGISVNLKDENTINCEIDDEKALFAELTQSTNDVVDISLLLAENDDLIEINISGYASDENVYVNQDENGFSVSGIENCEISLLINNEVVETKTVSNSISDIDIVYDNTSDELFDVVYDIETEEEPDTDAKVCNHICHSDNSFLQFIWKIYNFLMKLFSMEKYCSCGVAHY